MLDSQPVTPADIRRAAIELLSRREHSVRELRQKLQRKFECDASLINEELKRLTAENYQSDRRFAEAFIVSRTRKGFGPQRLTLELKERGIQSDIVDEFLPQDIEYWVGIASSVRQKRFASQPENLKEQMKQSRFLQYRGFSADIIRKLF